VRESIEQMSEEPTQNFGTDNQILRQVLAKLEVMDTRLQFVETNVSKRGYDTKPIWERALSGIVEVKNELGGFKQEFSGFKQEFSGFKQELGNLKHEPGDVKHPLGHVTDELGDVKRELALVNKKIDVFNNDMLKLRADQLETEDRLRQLEG
jgi:hypothetical protein